MKLNLGSGQVKLEGYVNIDNRPEMNPDMILDITEVLPFDNNSIEYIRAFDILEHIPPSKVIFVMEELYRVLAVGGIFESSTPDAEYGCTAFQDPHHVSFWVMNSWLYYSDVRYSSLYGIKANFKIISLDRYPTLTHDNNLYWIHAVVTKEEAS